MANTVPLVIYKNGIREVIGEAHVEDAGVVVCIIYDSKVVETLGVAAEMSLGFPFARTVPPPILSKNYEEGFIEKLPPKRIFNAKFNDVGLLKNELREESPPKKFNDFAKEELSGE